jgi:predicted negative regulator of RcsB-dependent stress response
MKIAVLIFAIAVFGALGWKWYDHKRAMRAAMETMEKNAKIFEQSDRASEERKKKLETIPR